MGYNLSIGEAEIDWYEDCVGIVCPLVTLPNAPAYGDPIDYQNQRWPSYIVWADCMRQLDLMDVMFNKRNGGKGYFERDGKSRGPLIEEHPGAVPVTKEHVEEVEARLAAYRAKHPTHRAEYPPVKAGAKPVIAGSNIYREEDYVDDPEYDSALCRGEWLAFWLRWAYENCQRPVFVNS